MIIFKSKLFSELLEKFFSADPDSSFRGQCKLFNCELLKYFLMHDKLDQGVYFKDLEHWVGEAVGAWGKVKEVNNKTDLMYGFSQRRSGTLGKYLSKYPTPKDYFLYIWKKVYEQTKEEKPKYIRFMSRVPSEDEISNYLHLFKYVLLCLCGQVNPDIETPWADYNKIFRLQPSFQLSQKWKVVGDNKEKLFEKFMNILSQIDY